MAASAQQLIERPPDRFAANVPQGHVNTAHRHGAGSPHTMATKLEFVDTRPDAVYVGRVHAEH